MASEVQITFRKAQPGDENFLRLVYASTRAAELALVPHWSEDQKSSFVSQQFEAQDTHYKLVYPDAEYLIINIDSDAAGRLYVHYAPKDIRIIDIALLDDFRGQGYGSRILKDILQNAQASGRTVSIHVEKINPALGLYQKLGFQIIEDTHGLYYLMKWHPVE